MTKVTPQFSNEEIENIVNSFADQTAADEPIENYNEIQSIFSDQGSIHDLMKRLEGESTEFAEKTKKTLSKIFFYLVASCNHSSPR